MKRLKPMLMKYWPTVVALVVLAIVAFQAAAIVSADRDEVAFLEEKAEQVSADANAEEAAVAAATDDVVRAVTGMSRSRQAADDLLAEDLMSRATTWSTQEEYNMARESAMRRHDIAEDSPLMESILPFVPCNTTSNGEEICLIDVDGLNSSFEWMDSSVVSVTGTKYSYFAVVGFTTESRNGKGRVLKSFPVSYVLDDEGTFSDIEVYPSTADVRSSD